MEDTHCHMPSKTGFPAGSPFTKHIAPNKGYTFITLGKDKEGRAVREQAHVLITAARYGVPDSLFVKDLNHRDVHQALHQPKCPHVGGGCNNPLHMRWGLPKENKLDQSSRHTRIIGIRVAKLKEPSPSKGLAIGSRVTRSQAKAKSRLVTL